MARKISKPDVWHVVMRHNWRPAGSAGWDRVPGMIPLARYSSAGDAEADRAAREGRARKIMNPFSCARLGLLTSLPENIFCDVLSDLTLEPPNKPQKGTRDWEGWWPTVPEEKRPGIWQHLDRLRFYEVVQRPVCSLGYALVSLVWDEDFEDNEHLNDEGGRLDVIHKNRTKAKEVAESRSGWANHGARYWWLPQRVDPLDPEAIWREYCGSKDGCDLVEIELPDVPAKYTGRVHAVVRRVWNTCESHPNSEEHVPVAAFVNRQAAEARCRELEEEVKQTFDIWPLFSDEWDSDQRAAFLAAAAGLGLPGTRKGSSDWWAKHLPVLTTEQRVALWEAVAAVPTDDPDDPAAIWVYQVVESKVVD